MCHHRPLHSQMTKWAHIWMWYDMYCSNVDVHIKYPWFAGMFSANILFWWLGRVTPLKQSENNVLFLRFTAFLSPTPLPLFIHCPARSTTGSGRRGQQIHESKKLFVYLSCDLDPLQKFMFSFLAHAAPFQQVSSKSGQQLFYKPADKPANWNMTSLADVIKFCASCQNVGKGCKANISSPSVLH